MGNSWTENYDVTLSLDPQGNYHVLTAFVDSEIMLGGYTEYLEAELDEDVSIDMTSQVNALVLYDRWGNMLSNMRSVLSEEFSEAEIEDEIILGGQSVAETVAVHGNITAEDVYSTSWSYNQYDTNMSAARGQADLSISESTNYDNSVIFSRDITRTTAYNDNGLATTQISYHLGLSDQAGDQADNDLDASDALVKSSKVVTGYTYTDDDTNADTICRWNYNYGDDDADGVEDWQETTLEVTQEVEYDGRGQVLSCWREVYDIDSAIQAGDIEADPTDISAVSATSLVRTEYEVNHGYESWGGVTSSTVYNLSGVALADVGDQIMVDGQIQVDLITDLNNQEGFTGCYTGSESTEYVYEHRQVQASKRSYADINGDIYQEDYSGGSNILDAIDEGIRNLGEGIEYDEAGNQIESYTCTVYYEEDGSEFSRNLTHSYNLYLNEDGLAGEVVTEQLSADGQAAVQSVELRTGGRSYVAEEGEISVGAEGEIVITMLDSENELDVLLSGTENDFIEYDRFGQMTSCQTDTYSGGSWDNDDLEMDGGAWASRSYLAYEYGDDVAGAKGNALVTVNAATDQTGAVEYSLDLTLSDSDILGDITFDQYGNNVWSKTGSWRRLDDNNDGVYEVTESFVASSLVDTYNYFVADEFLEDVVGDNLYGAADYTEYAGSADTIKLASGRSNVIRTDSKVFGDFDEDGTAVWEETTSSWRTVLDWGADGSERAAFTETYLYQSYDSADLLSSSYHLTNLTNNLGRELSGTTYNYDALNYNEFNNIALEAGIPTDNTNLLSRVETENAYNVTGNLTQSGSSYYSADDELYQQIYRGGSDVLDAVDLGGINGLSGTMEYDAAGNLVQENTVRLVYNNGSAEIADYNETTYGGYNAQGQAESQTKTGKRTVDDGTISVQEITLTYNKYGNNASSQSILQGVNGEYGETTMTTTEYASELLAAKGWATNTTRDVYRGEDEESAELREQTVTVINEADFNRFGNAAASTLSHSTTIGGDQNQDGEITEADLVLESWQEISYSYDGPDGYCWEERGIAASTSTLNYLTDDNGQSYTFNDDRRISDSVTYT